MSRKGPILVTGATGMLGGNLLWQWRGQSRGLAALVRNSGLLPPGAWPGVAQVEGDITDSDSLRGALDRVGPSLVVHCAAMARVDECQHHPETARLVNREGTRHVALAASRAGADLVHISTDAVYAQGPGPHREGSQGGELSVYAQTKLEAEEAALSVHPQALVLRTCLFGYYSDPAQQSMAQWMAANLEAERPFPGFVDVRFSPLFTGELATWILAGAGAGLQGVYNLGPSEGMSKYQFARRLALGIGKDPALVRPTQQGAAGLATPRPRDPVMDSSRFFRALAAPAPGMESQIAAFLQMKQSGGQAKLRRFGGYP